MANKQALRDKNSKLRGFVETDEKTGNQVLYDKNQAPIGYYDSKRNTTRGRNNGKLVGFGNLLGTLIKD